MKNLAGRALVCCFTVLSVSCSDGKPVTVATNHLIRVHDGSGNYAQYIAEDLPGKYVQNANGGSDGETSNVSTALVANYDTTPGWVYQGQSNAKFSGTLSSDSVAIGIAAPDVETGYWVKPAGTPDPVNQELTWSAYLDVSEDVEPGYHEISMVAIGDKGNAGNIVKYPLCVRSRVPDNFNACDPSIDAPNAVISLSWDSNVDLDLQVVGPDGTLIDSKHPTTTPVGDAIEPTSGFIDRDSNAGCSIDGIRYESLVWNTSNPKGRYGIYANLFDACKQSSVHFKVAVYSAVDSNLGGKTLKNYYSQSGVLMDYQANGGETRGLFIVEFEFE